MCIYSIIYYLGPTYRITSDVISLFIITFIGIFIAKKYEDNEGVEIFAFIAYFLGLAIIIFGNLIYNEVIILEFWDLDIDVKEYEK